MVALALATGSLWLVVPAGAAQAHPLGNFTVNHADDLSLRPDGVALTSILDRAEIPTAQALQGIAPGGSPTAAQLGAAAEAECPSVAAAISASVGGRPLQWQLQRSSMRTVPGAGGLPTLRLTCEFTAAAELGVPTTVEVADGYLPDRVGWREMTADGNGVRLVDSPVPTRSSTDQLRQYPVDLLASPSDVRGFVVGTEPGENTGSGSVVPSSAGDPLGNTVAGLDRRFEDLAGGTELTPLIGTFAVLLAVLLGCGHALLPGHGKSVMAAYLAGRRGRSRDAVLVGATVTATHTVGVLVLGAAISVSSSLAGDQVVRWLGVASGLLVAGIGAAMLRGALPRWRAARVPGAAAPTPVLPEPALAGVVHGHHDSADHGHDHGNHAHGHGDSGDHDHGHIDHIDHDRHDGHGHDHDGHDHDGHDHHGHDHQDHDHGAPGHDAVAAGWWAGGHSHGPDGHTHGPGGNRGGLIGMGVAGGLVPSPSALIVLLASIGLGRTAFGVVLVLAYGLGMAGTLTAVGLALVKLRDRLERQLSDLRRARLLSRFVLAMPVLTATLVLVVGLSLILRGVALGA